MCKITHGVEKIVGITLGVRCIARSPNVNVHDVKGNGNRPREM